MKTVIKIFVFMFVLLIIGDNVLAIEYPKKRYKPKHRRGYSYRRNDDRKGYIGNSGGPSYSIGEFKEFAGNGGNYNLIFGYKFGENFGISASSFAAAHIVKDTEDNTLIGYYGLMFGPMYSIPIGEKIEFDLKGHIGYLSDEVVDYYVEGAFTEYGGTGGLLGFGTSFRYNFAEKWCLSLNADYLTSKSTSHTYSGTINADQVRISGINLGLGIAFRIR